MTLKLTPVEPHTIVLAANYMHHLLLPFAVYCTGNHILRFSDFITKPYARGLAIKSSSGRQSKAFDMSVNKAPNAPPLSKLLRHFSIIVIRYCCES